MVYVTWTFFAIPLLGIYGGIRLYFGARDDFLLVGEFIGLMILSNIAGALVVPIICVRRFIAQRGLDRSMRYLVDLSWASQPPSHWTRLKLWFSGVDWRLVLASPARFRLFRWQAG